MRLFPVAVTTFGIMIAPIVGVFSGTLILGEPLGWPEFTALALVLAAIGLPALSSRRMTANGKTP